jgi:hypothetical protein
VHFRRYLDLERGQKQTRSVRCQLRMLKSPGQKFLGDSTDAGMNWPETKDANSSSDLVVASFQTVDEMDGWAGRRE